MFPCPMCTHLNFPKLNNICHFSDHLTNVSKLLKEIVQQISTPLAKLFNLSLEEGIVPSEWKEANITLLFKNGSRKKPDKYRPVGLTSFVCCLLRFSESFR